MPDGLLMSQSIRKQYQRLTHRGSRYPQTPIDFIGFSRFELKKMPAEYVPTADQRALVENASAFGLTQADIAEQLGCVQATPTIGGRRGRAMLVQVRYETAVCRTSACVQVSRMCAGFSDACIT